MKSKGSKGALAPCKIFDVELDVPRSVATRTIQPTYIENVCSVTHLMYNVHLTQQPPMKYVVFTTLRCPAVTAGHPTYTAVTLQTLTSGVRVTGGHTVEMCCYWTCNGLLFESGILWDWTKLCIDLLNLWRRVINVKCGT